MDTFYTNTASFYSLQVTGSTLMTSSTGPALTARGSGSAVLVVSGSTAPILTISDDLPASVLFSVSTGSTTVFSIDSLRRVKIESGSLCLPTGSGSDLEVGSIYYSESRLYIWNGSKYISSSLFT